MLELDRGKPEPRTTGPVAFAIALLLTAGVARMAPADITAAAERAAAFEPR